MALYARAAAFGIVASATVSCAPRGGGTDTRAFPHDDEPIGSVRAMYDGALSPELAVTTFRNIHRLFPVRVVQRSPNPRPLPAADRTIADVSFTDRGRRYTLEQYIALNRVAGLLVLADGHIALEVYRFGNTRHTRWMSMSIAKSITSTLVGAALRQGFIHSLDDPVTRYVPALRGSAYEGVSVRDVLMMASGVRWNETYTDPASDRRRLLEAQISQTPGAAMRLMASLPRVAEPGARNNYSTGETQVAGEIVRGATGSALADYLGERIWRRYGMESDATWWLDSPDGAEIGGSGFSATLRDYGRFGLFLLDEGVVGSDTILPPGWVREASAARTLRGGERVEYGYLWWPGTSAAAKRDGAFSGAGIFGQWLYVNPAARVVVVVWSAQTLPTGGNVVEDDAFLDAVAELARSR